MATRVRRPVLGAEIVIMPPGGGPSYDVMVRRQQGFAEILEVERTAPVTGVREVGLIAAQYPTGHYWVLREFVPVDEWKGDATGEDGG